MDILKRVDIVILIPAVLGLSTAIIQYITYISQGYCDLVCSGLVAGPYSTLFGVPIIMLSITYFSLMIGYSLSKPVKYIKHFFIVAIVASIVSIYLLYLLFYVLESICIYCIIQHISLNIITILLAVNILRSYMLRSPPTSS